VEDLLTRNLPGLALPMGWATDGLEANGEVVCWTLPGSPPGPGADCPEGSNALQVITPPVEVHYAFAPVLGKNSNNIKATAAAGAGPAAPNNCVLCLLEPAAPRGLQVLGAGDVDVDGGGIVVNSDNPLALVLGGSGDVRADQIRVVGLVSDLGTGQLLPPAEEGGPPVPDPLEGLPTPDELPVPPVVRQTTPQTFTTNTTIQPGIYDTVTVQSDATLTLEAGVYVFTGLDGLTVENTARVVNLGDGVTIYLACDTYPTPCSGPGARFQLRNRGRFLANPPSVGEYAGLSIFADRGNTTTLSLQSTRNLNLAGALYGPSTPVRMESRGDLAVNSLMVVDSLALLPVSGPDPSVDVSYDPSLPIPGFGVPVLIR
jgi:hypothetical protein